MEDGALRLLLRLDDPEGAAGRLALEVAQAELAQLRALAEDAPGPIWALDAAGHPVWANWAYLQLADLAQGGKGAQASRAGPPGERPDHRPDHRPPERPPSAWPARPLFEPPTGLVEGQAETRRMSLQLPGKPDPEWFDVTSVRRGTGSVHFATDVGRLVGAEASRSTFVQTLSKAFAHLTVGLAVFDKQRRLTLFNPAFADLTGLSFSFLSGRPLVHTVLDRLREAQVLPEPRNYASWRDGVAALEAAASAGTYCETWSLPDGRTFRVTGRPHPDGALAFLVEDITDEIVLARRVRAELDTARAVLDSLTEGVAVFTAAGTLSLSNAAYDALWREAEAGATMAPGGPEASGGPAAGAAPVGAVAAGSGGDLVGLTDPNLWGELDRWERALGACKLWDDLRAGRAQRGGGAAEVGGVGAPALLARATPLPGGGLVVGFTRREERDAPTRQGPLLTAPEAGAPAGLAAPAEPGLGRARAAL
jgi:PAS domain-containing protein